MNKSLLPEMRREAFFTHAGQENRFQENIDRSREAAPSTNSWLVASPIALANLKPCPEKPAANTSCGCSG